MQEFSLVRIVFLSMLGLSTIALGQNVTLSAASGSETPDGTVVLPITITSAGGAQAADIQWSLVYSSDITDVTVSLGNSGAIAQKSLSCNVKLCVVAGLSRTIIPDGTLAIATFQIPSGHPAHTIPIQISGIVAASVGGQSILANSVSDTSSLSVDPPTLSGIVCSNATVNTPGYVSCVVSLTSAAFKEGFSLKLSSSNANLGVPPNVTVAAGQTSASFLATAVQVNVDQAATIVAGTGSKADSVILSLVAPIQLSGIVCSPTALSSGIPTTCTFSLSKATPVAAVVSIDSNNAIVSIAGSVTVAAGESSANVQATAGNVSHSQNATITGNFNRASLAATLTLNVPPIPAAVSVSPSASTGTTQIFTVAFSDSQSAANLSTAAVRFATSEDYPNSCFVIYDRNRGTIQLEWDNAAGADEKPVSSALTLQNTQCAVGATSVATSALTTSIALAITFKGAFSGLKNIYMYGADGTINTGWMRMGTYGVITATSSVPSADSVSPSGSGGAAQDFTFLFSDSQNAANISTAAILFASSLAFPNSCLVMYDRNRKSIQLEWDNASGADEMPVGSSSTLQNGQCLVGATSVTNSALSITITLAITFKDTFTGLKNIYMYAADTDGTINTGWVGTGTWTLF